MRRFIREGQRGHSLAEMLTVLAIVGFCVGVMVPVTLAGRRRAAVRAAASELRGVFHNVRMRAIATGRNTALKFSKSADGWVYTTYEDGDGDGVRNNDIASGTDRPLELSRPLLTGNGRARIAMPSFPLRDPDSGRVLGRSASAVRFNRSTLCSFSANGSGTSGSIFLTDGHERAAVVRIFGPTGRVRLQRYDRQTAAWRND